MSKQSGIENFFGITNNININSEIKAPIHINPEIKSNIQITPEINNIEISPGVIFTLLQDLSTVSNPEITLGKDAIFKFNIQNINYIIKASNGKLVIDTNNIVNMLDILTNTLNLSDLNLSVVEYGEILKQYKNINDKNLLKLFIEQNNLSVNFAEIDDFINKHFFEMTLICKSFEGSNLENLPIDLIGYIASDLEFSDIIEG